VDKRVLAERTIKDESGGTAKRPRRSVTVNEVESPLGWLHRHGHLSVRQFDAGEQLRSDWERAQLSPRVTMRWDPSMVHSQRGPQGGMSGSDRQVAAKDRFDGALAEAGADMSEILWRIVCAGEGMREAESALGWPARAGKLVLRMALDRVANFYRLPG